MRNRSIRASDADRDAVAAMLQDHAVAGRLTTDELAERIGRALAARTLGELDALVADLPSVGRHRPATAKVVLLLLAEGALLLLVGLIIVTIAILWALGWTAARLAAAAVRSLNSGHAPALRGGA